MSSQGTNLPIIALQEEQVNENNPLIETSQSQFGWKEYLVHSNGELVESSGSVPDLESQVAVELEGVSESLSLPKVVDPDGNGKEAAVKESQMQIESEEISEVQISTVHMESNDSSSNYSDKENSRLSKRRLKNKKSRLKGLSYIGYKKSGEEIIQNAPKDPREISL